MQAVQAPRLIHCGLGPTSLGSQEGSGQGWNAGGLSSAARWLAPQVEGIKSPCYWELTGSRAFAKAAQAPGSPDSGWPDLGWAVARPAVVPEAVVAAEAIRVGEEVLRAWLVLRVRRRAQARHARDSAGREA